MTTERALRQWNKSYTKIWNERDTCLARSATLALVVLLSWVSSVKIAISSSVSVGSRPHSWSSANHRK